MLIKRKLLAVLTILSLVLALSGSALAGGQGKGQDHDKGQGHDKGQNDGGTQGWHGPFGDCEDHWAKKQIAKMHAAGLLNGVSDEEFDPEGDLTRAQAACLWCRCLGIEDEADEEGEEGEDESPFADRKSFPDWAVKHIRACYEHRLMLGEVRGDGRVFNPNKPITRVEFAVLLLRALDAESPEDLEALAASLMGERDQLTFNDAPAIGDWAVGYVLVALQEGWLTGYEDGTFKPNKPVTRAEAAALLDAVGEDFDWTWPGRYSGTLVSVTGDGGSITIHTEGDDGEPGEDLTFEIGEDCGVEVGKQDAALGDLEAGWEVRLYVRDGLVVYIDASAPESEIEGLVTAVTAGSLTVNPDEPEGEAPSDVTVTYEAASAVTVKSGGEAAEWADIEVGDRVELELRGDLVFRVTIEDD